MNIKEYVFQLELGKETTMIEEKEETDVNAGVYTNVNANIGAV